MFFWNIFQNTISWLFISTTYLLKTLPKAVYNLILLNYLIVYNFAVKLLPQLTILWEYLTVRDEIVDLYMRYRRIVITRRLNKWRYKIRWINEICSFLTWDGVNSAFRHIINAVKRTFGFGFYYIQGFIFILAIDACLTDDEPLWEPIEWSMVQTWILFIFIFAWIGENLIVSRYGSYTGRDKRVWMAWYKTFWLLEMYYMINFAVAASFVIVPFYFELNYTIAFIYSWWHWYSRVFFFQFISMFSIILLLAYFVQINLRWLNWKKLFLIILLIILFLSYLLYVNFIMAFFGYFTNPIWYQQVRPIDYIQLSHEPARWGWGTAKKDHFTYHNVKTVFWFKNDGPFASALLLFHLFIFLSLFFVYIYWIALFRRVYSMKEVPITYFTYCVSTLKQYFYCFLALYFFIFISFIANYWRLPIEYSWSLNNTSWFTNLYYIFMDYPTLIISLFI